MEDLDKFWSKHIGSSVTADARVVEAVLSGKGIELLVDGDIVAYRASAACDGRQYFHPEVDDMHWKYKKDADQYCVDHGLDKARLTKVNKPEPESHAIKNVETTLSCIVSHFEGVDVRMKIYLSGEDNFRNAIAETYKAHRADAERPYHLDTCKNYLWDTYLAEAQDGLEADDLMGIRACILHALPADYCICTTDKDLMGIPGCHYNWVTGQERLMSEREADLFFYTQLLTGDTTDNIPGLKGCGPKGAQRILKKFYDDPKLISTKALYSTVLDAYIAEETRLHGADEKLSPRNIWELAKANLVCNAQQLWILREPFVMWQPPRFVASDFVGGCVV